MAPRSRRGSSALADARRVCPDVSRRSSSPGCSFAPTAWRRRCRAVEDGRSHADRVRPRRDGLQRIHHGLCGDRLVCAEYAGDHGLRSRQPDRRRRRSARGGGARHFSMPPRRCWRSGFSASSSTANSSISGSRHDPKSGNRFSERSCSNNEQTRQSDLVLSASLLVMLVGAPRSISWSIRCSSSGRRASLRRCIRRTAACRMPD